MPGKTDPLAGSRIKVERAKEHLSQLETEIQAFLGREPYRIVVEDDTKSGDRIYRVKVAEQPPMRWGAIIGDVVHNLRSSLDLLACQLVIAEGKVPDTHTQFPIFEDASPEAVRLIENLQPYKGGNEALWRTHRLDISDKHRLLIPVGAAHTKVTMQVTFSGSMALGREDIQFPPIPLKPADNLYPLEDDVEVLRIKSAARAGNRSEVKEDYMFTFSIAFGDGEVVQGQPVLQTLRQLIEFAESIIDMFERHVFSTHQPYGYGAHGMRVII